MEGKELRFGIADSVLAAVVTSNGATGATNSMHDSYTPLGGLVPLVNMALGEIVFGGLGTGLYSIVLVALVGLFIAGLMVGRTPEYLGKKIDPGHIKVIMLYTLYNLTTVVAMLVGRFGLGVLALALAGIFARQRRREPSLATLPTASATFGAVIVGTAILVGALTFLSAIALGPLVEQLTGR